MNILHLHLYIFSKYKHKCIDSEVTKGLDVPLLSLPLSELSLSFTIMKIKIFSNCSFTIRRLLWPIFVICDLYKCKMQIKKKYNIKISWSEDFKMASYYPISKSFGGRRKEMRAQYCEMWQWKTSPHLLIIINIVRDKPSYSSRTIQTLKTSKSLASTRLVTNNSNKPKC